MSRPTQFVNYNRPTPNLPPTTTKATTKQVHHDMVKINMQSQNRGENLAKLIETRNAFLTKQKTENARIDLERIAGVAPEIFFQRAEAHKADTQRSEMGAAKTSKDLEEIVRRIRSR